MERVSNNLPIFGGAAAPVLVISYSTVVETMALAAIGALTGLLVKIIFDFIVKKVKNNEIIRRLSKNE